jgi:predicted component of type VI protein secretion system
MAGQQPKSNNDNARHAIEKLLTTQNSPGEYSTGSELSSCPVPTVHIVLRNDDGDETDRKKMTFPLDANGVEDIKNNAERAGVGLFDRTVVNLDVRKT